MPNGASAPGNVLPAPPPFPKSVAPGLVPTKVFTYWAGSVTATAARLPVLGDMVAAAAGRATATGPARTSAAVAASTRGRARRSIRTGSELGREGLWTVLMLLLHTGGGRGRQSPSSSRLTTLSKSGTGVQPKDVQWWCRLGQSRQ